MIKIIKVKKFFKQPRKIKLLLISIIIIYFMSFSITFFVVSSSFYYSITRIHIPDDYLLITLDPSSPRFETSYTIYNKDGLDFTELNLNLTVKLEYIENVTYSLLKQKLFNKFLKLNIPAFTIVSDILIGSNECFYYDTIQEYWNTVANTTEIRFFMDLDISGKYCLGTIPFHLSIKDFEVGKSSGCENCGGGIL